MKNSKIVITFLIGLVCGATAFGCYTIINTKKNTNSNTINTQNENINKENEKNNDGVNQTENNNQKNDTPMPIIKKIDEWENSNDSITFTKNNQENTISLEVNKTIEPVIMNYETNETEDTEFYTYDIKLNGKTIHTSNKDRMIINHLNISILNGDDNNNYILITYSRGRTYSSIYNMQGELVSKLKDKDSCNTSVPDKEEIYVKNNKIYYYRANNSPENIYETSDISLIEISIENNNITEKTIEENIKGYIINCK